MARHYSKAPIVEAVIDLRSVATDPFGAGLAAALARDFPPSHPIISFGIGAQFKVEEGEGDVLPSARQAKVGTRYASSSNDRVLQLHNEGFTYSHLAPYSDWNRFRDEAIKLWGIFQKEGSVGEVTRIAVRVINKLDLQGDLLQLQQYTPLHPAVPSGIELRVDQSVMQLQASLDKDLTGGRALINMSARNSSPPHISASENGEIAFEWWIGNRKLTLYCDEQNVQYIRVWGVNINSEMDEDYISNPGGFRSLWNWLRA